MIRVDREFHPGAWWIWATAMAVAVTRSNNYFYAVVVIVIAAAMVERFRQNAPWSRAFHVAMTLAAIVFSIRVAIGLLLGVSTPGTTLFTLPRITLPEWFAGVRIGGPVTAERLGSVLGEGLVIVAIIGLIGAATALTNPRRLLRILPGAVHEAGVAVVVATTFTPQLIMSVRRVQEARRLRGHLTTGVRGLRGLARPVLEDALDRALALGAAMESRGYGRRAISTGSLATSLLLVGLVAMGIGMFGVLATGLPRALSGLLLTLGVALAMASLLIAGKSNPRTQYRPERWQRTDSMVVLPAIVAALVVAIPAWPTLQTGYSAGVIPPVHPALICGLFLGVLPALMLSRSST